MKMKFATAAFVALALWVAFGESISSNVHSSPENFVRTVTASIVDTISAITGSVSGLFG